MFSQGGWLHCSPPAVARPWQGKKLVQHVSRLKEMSALSLLLQYHPSVGEPPTPSGGRQNVRKINLVTSHDLDCFKYRLRWVPQKVIHLKQWWSMIWDALEISSHRSRTLFHKTSERSKHLNTQRRKGSSENILSCLLLLL